MHQLHDEFQPIITNAINAILYIILYSFLAQMSLRTYCGYIAFAMTIIIIIGLLIFQYGSSSTYASMETNGHKNVVQQNISEEGTDLKEYSHQKTYDQVDHNLINITDRPFVGRENDISEVSLKMERAHIISINGAPGFGKSTLAIHVGYKKIEQGIPVRYVDVSESKLVFTHRYGTHSQIIKSNGTSIIGKDDLPLGYSFDQLTEKELLTWSKNIKSRTLLVLDNCDDELVIEQHTNFVEFLQKMALYANQNLYILVTSVQHISIADDFDSWTVKELSHNASVELLLLLAPNISISDAEVVSHLVERCPLALKVIGQLLHDDDDMLTVSLKDELHHSLLNVLNEPSNPKQRFGFLMNTVLKRINMSEVLKCGLFISYFPGSFSKIAALNVIPSSNPKECLLSYVKHSLLDKHILFKTRRYKMHKLIKEYVQIKASEDMLNTQSLIDTFHLKFHDHYTEHVLQYAQQLIHVNISDIEEFEFSSESHNIHHLLSILFNLTEFSTNDTHVLVTLVYAKILKIDDLRNHFQRFIESIIEVCNFLGTERCADFYPQITVKLLQECQSQNKEEIFGIFESIPCNRPIWCKITRTLFDYSRIFRKLDAKYQSYLRRISWWYCLENKWVYVCMMLHKMNTLLLLIVTTMNHMRITFDLKRYINKYIHICTLGIIYIVSSSASILAPILALTLENVVASDHFEVFLVVLNFFYVLCFLIVNKCIYITANVTLIPLLILMVLSKQMLDNILRLFLLNMIPLIYIFFNYTQELPIWSRYMSFTSFISTFAVVLIGFNKITLAVLAPYMISSFLNMCVSFLLQPKSARSLDIVCCVLLIINLSFPWNVIPISL